MWFHYMMYDNFHEESLSEQFISSYYQNSYYGKRSFGAFLKFGCLVKYLIVVGVTGSLSNAEMSLGTELGVLAYLSVEICASVSILLEFARSL